MKNTLFVLIMLCLPAPVMLTAEERRKDTGTDGVSAQDYQNMTSRYYAEMSKEEFLVNFIPKEKFLLDFARNITSEIERRKSEGSDISELAIDDLTTPREKLMTSYKEELELLVSLMDEVEELERRAKRNIDLAALDALEKLKNRLRQILAARNVDMTGSVRPAGKDNGKNEPAAQAASAPVTEEKIASLYEEWQYNRLLSYKAKLTEYELLRVRLLKTASSVQEERMFRTALKSALESYNSGDFELSRLQLNDIIAAYGGDRILDDVYFYAAESCYGLNLLDESLRIYSRLIERFPRSNYVPAALIKKAFIYYIYGDYVSLASAYDLILERKNELTDEQLGVVSYLVGFVNFINGSYRESLRALANVRAGSRYFYPAIYLAASCHSSTGNTALAEPVFKKIIDTPNKGDRDALLAQIKNNALLKMGLIYYEKGQDDLATRYFSQVTQNFQNYDLSLMGKAWSAYRSGRPGEALKNVEEVLHSSLLSNYTYEARVLAASSKELLGKSEEAISDLEKVFAAGYLTDISKTEEQVSLKNRMDEFEMNQRELKQALDEARFRDLEKIRRFLQDTQPKQGAYGEDGRGDDEFSEEAEKMRQKIANLDRLEQEAADGNNRQAVAEIRDLRSHMLTVLENHTRRFSAAPENPKEDPLIKKMGTAEFLAYTFNNLLSETVRKKEQLRAARETTAAALDAARAEDDFAGTVRHEVELEEINDYYGRLNQHEVWLRENMPGDVTIEVERWASFSGYGISSINFSRIRECEEKIGKIAEIVENIDYIFANKRRNMDNRIKGLLLDVAEIEEQMRKEADKKAVDEKERFFKVDYFNRRKQESSVTGIESLMKTEKTEEGGEK